MNQVDPTNNDEILQTFFIEAKEMLQQMEDTLLALEEDPCDSETLNSLFRAAHTVKGSAGLFGLNKIVSFTHQVESVLDRLRSGEIVIDSALSDVLFKSCDVLKALIHLAESGSTDQEALAQADYSSDANIEALAKYLSPSLDKSAHDTAVTVDNQHNEKKNNAWHIKLAFSEQTFVSGLDPISIIAYLNEIGSITSIQIDDSVIPRFEDIDPERCHLTVGLRFESEAGKEEIDAAFEFVRDNCEISIESAEKRAADFLINSVTSIAQEHDDLSTSAVAINNADQQVQKQSKAKDHRQDEARYVRVPADKLDQLINRVGELVISGAGTSLLAQRTQDVDLIEATQQLGSLVEEIRNDALSLRMVQIGETFGRFRRVVRDVANELSKEVRLVLEGSETELDKSVVEKISDPLMHLVRNALDHGIESPEVRLAAGKPSQGTLTLSAHHDSGNIVIRVSEDGRGIDGNKLVKKAEERGVIAPGAALTEDEKINLIFEPGLSTAEKITDLSGRGVGMDVVKRNIEALRGTVVVYSVLGQGTTIEIRLPLTLAIIDGFLVQVGASSYVIPLTSVVECIDADPERVQINGKWSGHLDLRGEVLPYLELREIFKVSDVVPRRRSIVVVKNADNQAGLVVDQLMGEYQTVIKPLGKLFKQLKGISGSTVLGSGEVALILDVPALVRLATEHQAVEA